MRSWWARTATWRSYLRQVIRHGVPSVARTVAVLFGIGIVGAVVWLASVKWQLAAVMVLILVVLVLVVGGYRVWAEAVAVAGAPGGVDLPLADDLRPLLRQGAALRDSWQVTAHPVAVQ